MEGLFSIVPYVPVCGNIEPHMFHDMDEVEVNRTCSGKSECGQWTHSAHDYQVKERPWCNGMCECLPRDHGPGRHK